MNSEFQNKFISILLIFMLFSHFSLLHSIAENYVLCIGTDGHVAFEKIADLRCCTNDSMAHSVQDGSGVSLQDQNCQDIPLDQACFEAFQFIPEKKNFDNSLATLSSFTLFQFSAPASALKLNKIPVFENIILKNYTTVSLLI